MKLENLKLHESMVVDFESIQDRYYKETKVMKVKGGYIYTTEIKKFIHGSGFHTDLTSTFVSENK